MSFTEDAGITSNYSKLPQSTAVLLYVMSSCNYTWSCDYPSSLNLHVSNLHLKAALWCRSWIIDKLVYYSYLSTHHLKLSGPDIHHSIHNLLATRIHSKHSVRPNWLLIIHSEPQYPQTFTCGWLLLHLLHRDIKP